MKNLIDYFHLLCDVSKFQNFTRYLQQVSLKFIFHLLKTLKEIFGKHFHILMNSFDTLQKYFHFRLQCAIIGSFHSQFCRFLRIRLNDRIFLHSIRLLKEASVVFELFDATVVSKSEFFWGFFSLDLSFFKLDLAESKALIRARLTERTLGIPRMIIFDVTALLPNFSVIWHF